MNSNLWITLGSAAGFVSTVGGILLWALKQVIRKEIVRSLHAELAPLRDEIRVLRAAVFNHLSHDQRPDERAIRESLGLQEVSSV